MKRIIYLFATLFIFIALISNVSAQTIEAKMVFDNVKHDFGLIKEDGGEVTHKFIFTNMGAQAIVITNVSSSCGCTTPSWSKEPIPPGGKGFVQAVFNPIARPGKFHKTVTVHSNATNNPVVLDIEGDVVPKPLGIEQEYKYAFGPIRLTKRNIHFSDIYNTETKTEDYKIINISEEPVTITFNDGRQMPTHLKVSCNPETLKPNQSGIITVTYNAAIKNDWGYVYDQIFYSFNGTPDYNNRMNISAVIKEKYSENMIKNPPVYTSINGNEFDFGTIKQGDKIEHIFKFKNTGKTDLVIRKTRASCGCTAIAPQDKVIKPGQESNIKAIFNSTGKSGIQHKSITITTNIPDTKEEPQKAEITLMMKGTVDVK